MIAYQEMVTDSQRYNCLTSTLATLCGEQNLDFSLMFLEDWSFQYAPSSDGRIGGRVIRDNGHYPEALLKYHGVEVVKELVPDIYSLQNRLQELEHNGGCAVVYDTFYCPWVYNYQKEHQRHYSLALGFEENHFFCADTVPFSERTELPLAELLQSDFDLVTVKQFNGNCKAQNYISIIKQAAEVYLAHMDDTHSLIAYADLIEQEFNLKQENLYQGTNSWVRAPFLMDLEAISRSRASFCFALQFLKSRNPDSLFYKQAEKLFHHISEEWYTAFLSSWKMFLSPDYDNDVARQELSAAIRGLAAKEQEAARILIQ